MTEIEEVQEGKAALTRRLTREGRWGLATAFKDRTVSELRKGGMKKAESNAEGWRRMATEFPPSPMVDKQKPNQSDVSPASQVETIDQRVLTGLPNSTVDDFQLDVLWVLDHLAHPDPNFSSAPSKGSVGLYFWAKRSPDKFMNQFGKILQQPKSTTSSHQGNEPEGDDALIEEIESLLGMSSE